MLGAHGYKTKKLLKESIGKPLRYVETSLHGNEFDPNGENTMVGPDAYRSRKWFATITCKDGIIVEVR